MEEEAAEDLGDGEDEVPVRNGPEHMPAKPLAELHGPFLSTRGAELSFLAKKVCQKNAKIRDKKLTSFRSDHIQARH